MLRLFNIFYVLKWVLKMDLKGSIYVDRLISGYVDKGYRVS